MKIDSMKSYHHEININIKLKVKTQYPSIANVTSLKLKLYEIMSDDNL